MGVDLAGAIGDGLSNLLKKDGEQQGEVKLLEDHSLWRQDGTNTFFINKGHSLGGMKPFYRLKLYTKDDSVREQLANNGVHFSDQATKHMVTLIQNRVAEAESDEYEFNEDVLSYSFEQLFDLLNTAKEFFDFEEKEKTVTDDLLHIVLEQAQQRCDAAEKLIKRFAYLHIDLPSLNMHERVVRLNCIWPVVGVLKVSWAEMVSWSFPPDNMLTDTHREARRRMEKHPNTQFRKGPVEMNLILTKHLTRQLRKQLAEFFPLFEELQQEDPPPADDEDEDEKEGGADEGDEDAEEEENDAEEEEKEEENEDEEEEEERPRQVRRIARSIQEDDDDEPTAEPWWKSSAFVLGGWLAALFRKKTDDDEEGVPMSPKRTPQGGALTRGNTSRRLLINSSRTPVVQQPMEDDGVHIPFDQALAAVSDAYELLKSLSTAAMGPVDPYLCETCVMLVHPPFFDYLGHRVYTASITSQNAVDVVRMISKYEKLVGGKITRRGKQMLSADLFELVDIYMDAYDRFTKDKLFNWVKNILKREIENVSFTEKDGFTSTHGPLDLFSNINNALDIAVEEHQLGGKALVRLFDTYANVVNFFQSSLLRTLGSAKVTGNFGDLHDKDLVEEIPLSATQNVTAKWVMAQANNAPIYQEGTKTLLDKCLRLLNETDVEERAETSETLGRVSEGFYNVGVRVADVLAEVVGKYLQKSLEVCFTDDWFDRHESTMQEVHGNQGDLDAIVDRFLKGISDAHVAHVIIIAVRRLVSHYFNFFVKHLVGKKLSVINDDSKFWDRIQTDQREFADYFQSFHELVDEKQFTQELEVINQLQELAEAEYDFLSVNITKLEQRFGSDPVLTTDNILEGILSLRDDVTKKQVAQAIANKPKPVALDEGLHSALEVNVERGEGLAIKDAYSSDPFVKIVLLGAGDRRLSERQTHVVKSNLNPVWNHTSGNYPSDIVNRTQKVLLECWDWDLIGGGDFMGRIFVDLAEIKMNGEGGQEYPVTMDLQPSPDYDEEVSGTISVTFRYWQHQGSADHGDDFDKSMQSRREARKQIQDRLGAMAQKQAEGTKKTSVLDRIAKK